MTMGIHGTKGFAFPNGYQCMAAPGNNMWMNSFGDVKQRSARDADGYLYDRIVQSVGVTNPAWTADKMFDNCFQLNAAGDYAHQCIERINVRRAWWAAKTYMVSAFFDCSVAGNISIIVDYPTAVDNYAAVTNVVTDSFTVAAGTGRIERQITLPDNAFVYGARIRIQSGGAVLKMNGFKCEPGSVASPLELWKIGKELADCQRYFEYANCINDICGVYSAGFAGSIGIRYATTKRDNPSVSLNSISATGLANAAFAGNSYISNDHCGLVFTTTSPVGTLAVIAYAATIDAEIR